MAKSLKKWAAMLAAFVLSFALVLGISGCGDNGDEPGPGPGPGPEPQAPISLDFTKTSLPIGDTLVITATTDDGSAVTWTSSDPTVATVSNGIVQGRNEGTTTITATTADGDTDTCEVVVGESFTYRAAFSASPTTWNPHTWENNTDSIILGYITMGFYDIQLTYDENGNAVGYEWVSEMAADDPTDVTSEYVGKYGVAEGDTAKAWRIPLNQAATWQNGDKITADDYIYSMQQQLDPVMLNRRSDSYTGSTFSIYGARNYLYSETEATYETVGSQGYATNEEAIADGQTLYIDMWNFYGLSGAERVTSVDTGNGTCVIDPDAATCEQWLPITDTRLWLDPVYYSDLEAGKATEADILDYVVSAEMIWAGNSAMLEVGGDYESYVALYVENEHLDYAWDWDGSANAGVGLVKVDDYTIDLILNSSISDFYLHYKLTSNWLVHEETYERTKQTVGDLVNSQYNTGSVENTMSYGPYILQSFNYDQNFTLVRNENWYGYSDGNHNGQFSTTRLEYTFITGETAKEQQRELFMQGNLSDYALDGTEYPTYSTSQYLMSEPESYTYQFFLCTNQQFLDSETTDTENHSVLGLTSFRKALSFSINRQDYISRFEPTSDIGLGILNYLYIYDPDTGAVYRESESAMRTLLLAQDFYEEDGVWYDVHGEEYGSIEDAYDALTGFDLAYAADLMEAAYAEAVKEDMYEVGQTVTITYTSVGSGISDNLQALINMMNGWMDDVIAACDEATFTDIQFEVYLYPDEASYWAALKAGAMDLSFSAWGGSAMDPWGTIFSCYIDPANTNNYGFDGVAKGIDITINYNGTDVTASMYDWAAWLYNAQADSAYDTTNLYEVLGVAVGDADSDFKLEVLVQCELAQLQTYCNLPIFYSYVTSLRSAQYNNGSDTYINNMIGYGGLRHVYYNYSDAQWTAFVQSQGGNLEDYYAAS